MIITFGGGNIMVVNNWLTTMPGVQANMNIDSFKVQVMTTTEIPYQEILDIVKSIGLNGGGFNKLHVVKEVRHRYNMPLREAKTIVETVAYREGLMGVPRLQLEELSILMYGAKATVIVEDLPLVPYGEEE